MTTRKTVVSDGLVINGVSGNVALEVHTTDAIQLPYGTTAQRPTGVNGYFRYNTSDGRLDIYQSGSWQQVATLDGGTFSGIVTFSANVTINGDRITFGDANFYADLVDSDVPYINFESGANFSYVRSTNTFYLEIGTVDFLIANSTALEVNGIMNADTIQLAGSSIVGKQAIYVSASAMYPRTTNGGAAGTLELATNDVMLSTMDFDATTEEAVQFEAVMPSSWNEGTITFKPIWSHPATATNFGVVWELAAVAFANDDALDTAFGTGQTSTDTGGTTNDLYIGPESSAITVAGSPSTSEYVVFQLSRKPGNGSDTMAVDARLHGIVLYVTTDAMTDT